MNEDEDKSEHEGGSNPNSIFGSRKALAALLFGCTSMLRSVASTLFASRNREPRTASGICHACPHHKDKSRKDCEDGRSAKTSLLHFAE